MEEEVQRVEEEQVKDLVEQEVMEVSGKTEELEKEG